MGNYPRVSQHFRVSLRTSNVVFNEFNIKTYTGIKASDRWMQRGLKPLTPSLFFGHK
jgi:hypothetical protein